MTSCHLWQNEWNEATLCLSEIIQSSIVKYKKNQPIEAEETDGCQFVQSSGKAMWWFKREWPPRLTCSQLIGLLRKFWEVWPQWRFQRTPPSCISLWVCPKREVLRHCWVLRLPACCHGPHPEDNGLQSSETVSSK